MKHLTRIVATLVGGLFALATLTGTALAYSDPIRPDSGTVPPAGPALYPASASGLGSSGWALPLVAGVALVAVLAIGFVLAQRIARNRRTAHAPA